MSKASKYKAGSKVATFRLPIDNYDKARQEINELLKRYEGTTEHVRLVPKVDIKPKEVKGVTINAMYQCGCSVSGTLFRRSTSCKKAIDKH